MNAHRSSERVAAAIRRVRPEYWRRLPPVRVELDGMWMPGWLLPVATLGAAVAVASTVAADRGQWILLAVIVVFMAVNPDGTAPGVFAVAVGALYVLNHPVAFSGPLHQLVALVPLTIVVSAMVPGVPWRAKIEVSVILVPLTRFAAVQVVAQPLVVVGRVVAETGTVVAWMSPAAAVAVAAGAWWFHRQLRGA